MDCLQTWFCKRTQQDLPIKIQQKYSC
jgi:hypothetical protein